MGRRHRTCVCLQEELPERRFCWSSTDTETIRMTFDLSGRARVGRSKSDILFSRLRLMALPLSFSVLSLQANWSLRGTSIRDSFSLPLDGRIRLLFIVVVVVVINTACTVFYAKPSSGLFKWERALISLKMCCSVFITLEWVGGLDPDFLDTRAAGPEDAALICAPGGRTGALI